MHCEFAVGLWTYAGPGVVKPKAPNMVTTDAYSAARSSGTGAGAVLLLGSGTWSYDPGVLTDDASYSASTSITPAPDGGDAFKYQAVAISQDPIVFEAETDSVMPYQFTMTGLDLQPGLTGLAAGYAAGAELDGLDIFDMLILAPYGATSVDALRVRYESMLGDSFDRSMVETIKDHLELVSLNVWGLTEAFDLLPETYLPITAGEHVFSEGIGTVIIPEPAALATLGLGALILGGRQRRPRRRVGRSRRGRRGLLVRDGRGGWRRLVGWFMTDSPPLKKEHAPRRRRLEHGCAAAGNPRIHA